MWQVRTHSRPPVLASRATGLALLTATALTAALLPATTASAAGSTGQTSDRHVTYEQWTTNKQFARGTFQGTRAMAGSLAISSPVARFTYRDPHGKPTKTYDLGRWISPWRTPGYAFTEMVPSWNARTPRDSWVQIQVRGRSESGRLSRWYTMGRWAGHDRQFRRTSVPNQSDALGYVSVDTLKAKAGVGFTSWQTRVTLLRRAGKAFSPKVDTVGAMTSRLPASTTVPTSKPGVASGHAPLDVPRYSQMVHRGHYPQFGNGGEAWCSPTSVSMVLGHYGRLPTAKQYAWVGGGHADPFVDHAARSTYDYSYRGAGNWAFSTAYAGTRTYHSFVTRLRDLTEAEQFIRAGIPVVASVKFGRGQLSGAPISATNGHLLVIVGFTANGDVVVNDPAAPSNGSVRRTYDRAQFENAWVPKSGGLAYIIRDEAHPLPRPLATNW